MIKFSTTTLFFATLIAFTNASGFIEVILASSNSAYVSTTICASTQCKGFDATAHKKKLLANVPLKLEDGEYNGYPSAQYDFHLEIFNTTEDKIGSVSRSVETNTEWQAGIIKTSEGFNVSYRFRTLCDDHYFGPQCQKYCESSSNTECTKNGDLKCMQGWTGEDCMTPICSSNCNNNGKCVSPDKCLCNNGFEGSDCSLCIPTPGCVHGSCFNNQSFTCACHTGYGGELCNVNLDICERQHPCRNGGECINDLKFGIGYQCKCPQGLVGENCEKPIDSVQCRHYGQERVCLNDGICISLDNKSMECVCKPGFHGKQCELGSSSSTTQHQQKVDDRSSNFDKMMWMMCALIFCVLLLTIVVIIGRRETVTKVEIVNTPTKSYKVYVIETSSPSKQGQHDPPPPYFPSDFQSLPTYDSLKHGSSLRTIV